MTKRFASRCGLAALLLLVCIAPTSAQQDAQQLSAVEWQSLGFSADGRFYADMVYGTQHDLLREQSHYFARLQILDLWKGELVRQRLLRKLLSLRSAVPARAIMLELLRRQAGELRRFQIESLEQGEVLFAGLRDYYERTPETTPLPDSANDYGVVITELKAILSQQAEEQQRQQEAQDPAARVYTAVRNAHTAVFYLRQIQLDGVRALRGQLVAVQSQGLPRRYAFRTNWATLLQEVSASGLDLEPVFTALSPDGRHLLVTVKIFTNAPLAAEPQGSPADRQLERNANYAYTTFSLQVF